MICNETNCDGTKKIKRWEIAGIFWILIVGSILHFAYEWSNNSTIVGIISPVNESVWEHLKLGYWSLLIFSIIEYHFIKDCVKSFFLGKGLGIIVLELTIVVIFYIYTSITKQSILWVDISIYILAAIFGQLVSYNLIKKEVSKTGEIIGLILIIVLGFLLIFFTFYPPRLPIFKDPITGTYGIYQLE